MAKEKTRTFQNAIDNVARIALVRVLYLFFVINGSLIDAFRMQCQQWHFLYIYNDIPNEFFIFWNEIFIRKQVIS